MVCSDNTPLSKVIDALQESDDHDKTMYVVTLFPAPRRCRTVFPAVVARMASIAFSNKSEKDLRRARQTTDLILFKEELDRLLKRHKELGPLMDHPGYKTLKQFAEPINIVEISNLDAHGASDFSAAGISGRRKAGYEAAASKLCRAAAGRLRRPRPGCASLDPLASRRATRP